MLDLLAEKVFGERDPAELFHDELEQELVTDNGRATLRVAAPVRRARRDRSEEDRSGGDREGRRAEANDHPAAAMSAYATSGARFEEGALRIFFEKPEDELTATRSGGRRPAADREDAYAAARRAPRGGKAPPPRDRTRTPRRCS